MFFGLLRTAVQAQDTSWTSSGDGLWQVGGNWSLGVAPSNNPNVNITIPGNRTVTIDAATPVENLTVTNLSVWSHTAINTLVLSSNSTPLNVLGQFAVGGWDPVNGFGTGALVVDSGQLVTTNASNWNYVGRDFTGTMTVLGGTWLGDYVGVGWGANANDSQLTIAGGTNLLSNVLLAFSPGVTGTILLTGGELVSTNSTFFNVGHQGIGSMTVSNGTWLGKDVFLGVFAGAQGSLTIAGGTNWLNNSAAVGYAAGATGTVNVTGGSLAITNGSGTAALVVGQAGRGTLNLSGGTTTVDKLIVTNGNDSVVNFNSGTLNVLNMAVTNNNAFTIGNGTDAATLRLRNGGMASFANGLVVTNNGTLTGGGTINGDVAVGNGGTLAPGNSPGTLTVNGNLTFAPSGSIYNWEIGAASDLIDVTGSGHSLDFTGVAAGGISLNVLAYSGYPALYGSEAFALYTATSSAGITGFNANLFTITGDFVTSGTYVYQSGNTIYVSGLYNIPEPSIVLFLAVGGGLTRWRRRRK